MATAEEEKVYTEADLFVNQDKYAIFLMKHVMGTKDYPSGVAMTTNWTDKGLQKALDRHLRESLTSSRPCRLYALMKAEPELFVCHKVVSYPTVNDCLEHMAMMYRWEPNQPTFLVAETQMRKVMSMVS